MKKIVIFVIIVTIVFIGSLSAQGMGFGVKGGLNMGKFTGSDVKEMTDGGLDEKYLTAFSVGGFVTFPLGSSLTLRPEVLFTQNGARYEGSEEGVEAKISMKMSWLDIPVLAVFNLGNIGIFAGPYFDLFLSGKTKLEASYQGQSFDEEEDIKSEEIKSLLYGIIFGAAYGITDNIDIEVRYSQGLNSFDKEPDNYDSTYGAYEESDVKPSMIQLFVNFYLKK